MTKMKKFLALLASLTAVATLGLATACGDKGDSSTPAGSTPPASTPGDSTPDDSTPDDSTPVEKKYTITVKKPDGTPAAGIWIQTCVGTNCSTPAQADENGVFVFEYEDDATVYHVTSINGDDFADFEAVDFNTVPGTAAYEITLVAKAPAAVVNTVADVYAGENNAEFTVTGTILANSGKGFVLADATGSVFVYETCTANVGDVVTVKAVRATFGNCVQLKTATIEAAEGTAIQTGAIKELTAADCDAYKAATLMTPEYASFEGTLSVSQNKYFNIAIEGTEVIGSIVTPTDADKATLAELNGKKIKVEGYVVYVSSGKYLYSVATSITEVVEAPSIATPVSGTGTFEDAYVIEAGKTYVASKDAQGSVYFTMTNAQAGTYTFNLPETNEGAPYIEITGVSEVVDGVSFVANAGATVNIMISNSDWDESWNEVFFDTTFSVDFVAGDITPDGSELAPITVENGTTYTVGSWEGVWYNFTAPSAGQYKLSLTDWAAQADNFNFFDADYNTFNRGVATDIAAGETIAFKAYSYLDDASSWTFSFAATLENDTNFDSAEGGEDEDAVGTESNPFAIEAVGDYEITVAAGATYYAKLAGGAFQFVVPQGVKVFLYGMNSGYVEAGTLVAFTEYAMWNQEMYFDIINEGDEDVTITLSVAEYVAPQVLQVGDNDVVIEAGTEGLLCEFTAYVTGQYTFKSQSVFAKVFSAEDVLLGQGIVALEEGKTYIVRLSSPMGAGSYTLTIEAPAEDLGGDEGEGGSENEDGVLVLAVGDNTVVIDATNTSAENGVACYFTPEVKGIYQFAGNLMAVVYDENGNEIPKSGGRYTLNANELYIVVFYNFMNMATVGENKITVQLKEEIKDEPEEEGGLDIFAAPIVTEANATTQIKYTFTLTEDMNLTFTFDNNDTWFYVNNKANNQGISGHQKTVYEGTFPAGTYEMGIGTWTAANLTLTLTVTGTPVGGGDVGGDEGGEAAVVSYIGANGSGRAMKVTVDAANGTISVIRAALAGNSLDTSSGATEYTGTYSFDGTTVTCQISGCTVTWNADGTPATVTWGSAVYENFVAQA